MSNQMNRITGSFHFAMSKAISAESKDDVITHLQAMTNLFTQVCTALSNEESAKKQALKERDEAIEDLVELKSKSSAYDDVIQQFHVVLAAKNRNSTDLASQLIFDKMCDEVRDNMRQIGEVRMLEARLNVEKRRNERMLNHINELSKQTIMHLMATRFYARELAAMRQMMDLIRNASSVDSAVKSKVWDDIEAENRMLRLNTLWLINRINSPDRRDAVFEEGDEWSSPPRIVILMRDHIHQGLGLEIMGGCDQFRPVIVTAKLRGSMADDDELKVDDRILAVDGTFVTNTTTHKEVMEMLENESSKDFIALIVSQFDPTKYPSQMHRPSPHPATLSTSTQSAGSSSSSFD